LSRVEGGQAASEVPVMALFLLPTLSNREREEGVTL
jgi:hypothetical protein